MIDELSYRQIEFLSLAARGMSRNEIAQKCFASPWTVKAYLDSARGTLGAANLAHAVAKAVAVGALYIDDLGVAHADSALPILSAS